MSKNLYGTVNIFNALEKSQRNVFFFSSFFFWQQSDVLKEFPVRAFINFS